MRYTFLALCGLFLITACSGGVMSTPKTAEKEREAERGKLTGEGLNILGGGDNKETSGAVLGVNSFLWRATLDTLSFMPIASADPFGGVIVTDWYENPKTPGERYKVNALILDSTLRADGIRVTLFKQKLDGTQWRDDVVDPGLSRDLEDTILTRARQLRVSQLEKK